MLSSSRNSRNLYAPAHTFFPSLLTFLLYHENCHLQTYKGLLLPCPQKDFYITTIPHWDFTFQNSHPRVGIYVLNVIGMHGLKEPFLDKGLEENPPAPHPCALGSLPGVQGSSARLLLSFGHTASCQRCFSALGAPLVSLQLCPASNWPILRLQNCTIHNFYFKWKDQYSWFPKDLSHRPHWSDTCIYPIYFKNVKSKENGIEVKQTLK